MTNEEAIEELREKLIHIAMQFDKWLEDTANELNMDKNEVQALIKQLLQ